MDEARQAVKDGRNFLKANWESIDFSATDQNRGVQVPEKEKPYKKGSKVIELVRPEMFAMPDMLLFEAISRRKSRRKYGPEPLTVAELSYLLYATQGIKKCTDRYTLRTVPSAGARHSFETYLYCDRVTNIARGLYRYLPVEHQLLLLEEDEHHREKIDAALMGQYWNAAVVFMWTTVAYRMEWRYSLVAHKVIAIDAGHVCQNLYLACESIGCGTCAIAAYDQKKLDAFLGVDGENEFVIYAAPVGRAK